LGALGSYGASEVLRSKYELCASKAVVILPTPAPRPALHTLMRTKTTLRIAHRITTVQECKGGYWFSENIA